MKKIKSIVIIGKKWKDKDGNVYFSSVAIVDGIEQARIDYDFGYGNEYQYRIFTVLEENGIICDREYYRSTKEMLWSYCKRKNINFYACVSDVRTKKALKF